MKVITVLFAAAVAVLIVPAVARAHCDTLEGPVVADARLALDSGNPMPALKWIKPEYEAEIRAAFQKTLAVRSTSAEAREIADRYFFETLVRLHRAGEGEPYTGLKPTGSEVEPGIVQADKALQAGSVDELIKQVTAEIAGGIRQRFALVQESSMHADTSLEAGRRYVAAYVEFIHYMENIHRVISGSASGAHHARAAGE